MRILLVGFTLLSAAPTVSIAEQEPFEGTLVVQQGGREIGRERFSIKPGRDRGIPGSTLTVDGRYPAQRVTANAMVQRAADGSLALFRLRVDSPEGPISILAAGSGARLIVRTEAKGTETGGDMPAGPDIVLLDEHTYALYSVVADAATSAGTRLRAVFPRSGRRAAFTAKREGPRVQLTGEIAGTLTLDASGRLQRIEFPSAGIVATRQEN